MYRYKPASGMLGDVTVEWAGAAGSFQPLADGGVYFVSDDKAEPVPPESAKLLKCKQAGDTVESARGSADGVNTPPR